MGIALGSLVTTCGVIAGAPAVTSLVGGVAAAVAATQNAVSKHLEEKRDVTLEDFYFIWKAANHAPGEDS
jgi:xanthine dehydrogenase iron-sulfur cluster and FAD-binding subunit A